MGKREAQPPHFFLDKSMSFRIEISPDGQVVMLHADGYFDLSLGFAFWQYCQPLERGYRCYVFNFANVHELRDSGLGWLMQFTRRAEAAGASVRFVNEEPFLEKLYRAAGGASPKVS